MEEFYKGRIKQQMKRELTTPLTEAFQKIAENMTTTVMNCFSPFLGKEKSFERRGRFCYSCGDPSHERPNCPSKERGKKCLKCNNFGHLSTSCSVVRAEKRRKFSARNRTNDKFRDMSLTNMIISFYIGCAILVSIQRRVE